MTDTASAPHFPRTRNTSSSVYATMEPTVAFGGENEKAPDSGLRGRPCHKPSVNDYRYITLRSPSISMVGNSGVELLLHYRYC